MSNKLSELETLLSDIAGNNNNNAFVGAKNKRESFPTVVAATDVYPAIMTEETAKKLKPEQLSTIGGENVEVNYNSLLNQLHQLQTSTGQLASFANANSRENDDVSAGNDTTTTPTNGSSNERTKANKATFKTGEKETADANGTTSGMKCILNERLICVCVCED